MKSSFRKTLRFNIIIVCIQFQTSHILSFSITFFSVEIESISNVSSWKSFYNIFGFLGDVSYYEIFKSPRVEIKVPMS
jgi:hypothetical protein